MKVANFFSYLRIGFVPILIYLAFMGNYISFAIVIILGGITDALDGYFARKLNEVSQYGSDLDSMADALFVIPKALVAWLLFPEQVIQYLDVLVVLIIIFLAGIVMQLILHKKLIGFHLYSDKAAAAFSYCFVPYTLLFGLNYPLLYLFVIVVFASQIEELLATIMFKKIDP